MRKILLAIPAQPLFFVLIVLAAASLVRDVLHRRKNPKAAWGGTALYLAGGALVLMRVKTGSFVPSGSAFSADWGTLPIYAYGVMLGTAFVTGWFVAMKFVKQDHISQQDAQAIYMWTAVYSIVGARILYIIANIQDFKHDPMGVFMIQRGGLVAYGGMIGGFLASLYGCWRRKIPLLQWADASAPSVVLGTSITRIGCFLYGCDYGARTSAPWGMSFPKESPAWEHHIKAYGLPPTADGSFPVHPTQLYELIFTFALFWVTVLVRKKRKFSGQVFLTWVIGYGIGRPLIEILRDDTQRGGIGPLSTSQLIGIIATILGVIGLGKLWQRYKRDPVSLRLWERPLPAGGAPVEAAAAGKKRRRGDR